MIKPKLWNGHDLQGDWEVTHKIDGVRALVKDGEALSRAHKPLHNLKGVPDGDYEIFCGDWESSITAVRTIKGKPVLEKHIYSLDPLDIRLQYTTLNNPSKEEITSHLDVAVLIGYEGLVLRQGSKWLKVKPTETFDVKITGHKLGTGKYAGKLGAFLTDMGNVGTGLTDKDRAAFLCIPVGTYIEVECMHLTTGGKFRHPRFKRVRWDK